MYEPGNGPWLWGRISPTVLDIHVAIIIARLGDVGREALVPNNLGRFCDSVMEKKEWQDVYQSRCTMFGVP